MQNSLPAGSASTVQQNSPRHRSAIDRGAEPAEPLDLLGHRLAAEVEVHAVLHDLRLGDLLEQDRRLPDGLFGWHEGEVLLVEGPPLVAEGGRPEVDDRAVIRAVDDDLGDREGHPLLLPSSADPQRGG